MWGKFSKANYFLFLSITFWNQESRCYFRGVMKIENVVINVLYAVWTSIIHRININNFAKEFIITTNSKVCVRQREKTTKQKQQQQQQKQQ